jgi:hypothetical protein
MGSCYTVGYGVGPTVYGMGTFRRLPRRRLASFFAAHHAHPHNYAFARYAVFSPHGGSSGSRFVMFNVGRGRVRSTLTHDAGQRARPRPRSGTRGMPTWIQFFF